MAYDNYCIKMRDKINSLIKIQINSTWNIINTKTGRKTKRNNNQYVMRNLVFRMLQKLYIYTSYHLVGINTIQYNQRVRTDDQTDSYTSSEWGRLIIGYPRIYTSTSAFTLLRK
jgi:hypothetical protein